MLHPTCDMNTLSLIYMINRKTRKSSEGKMENRLSYWSSLEVEIHLNNIAHPNLIHIVNYVLIVQ